MIVSSGSNGGQFCAGIFAGKNYGTIYDCEAGGSSGHCQITCLRDDSIVGGIVGVNGSGGAVESTPSYTVITAFGDIGGIAGQNVDNAYVKYSSNYGDLSYTRIDNNRSVGGIIGYHVSGSVYGCNNYANIAYTGPDSDSTDIAPCMGQIIGCSEVDVPGAYCYCSGSVDQGSLKSSNTGSFGCSRTIRPNTCPTTRSGKHRRKHNFGGKSKNRRLVAKAFFTSHFARVAFCPILSQE